jgi:radical SAM protein with 4Fe4S-binding SPASM domain
MLSDNPSCSAAIDRLTISPDLYIYPCDAFKHISPEHVGIIDPYHNIKNNSLKSAWGHSKYFCAIREYLTTPFASLCISCNAIQRCLSGCAAQKIYASGNLMKVPDPMCLKDMQGKITTLALTPA